MCILPPRLTQSLLTPLLHSNPLPCLPGIRLKLIKAHHSTLNLLSPALSVHSSLRNLPKYGHEVTFEKRMRFLLIHVVSTGSFP